MLFPARKILSLIVFLITLGITSQDIQNFFGNTYEERRLKELTKELELLVVELNKNRVAKKQFDSIVEMDLGSLISELDLTKKEAEALRFVCNKTLLTPYEVVLVLGAEGIPERDVSLMFKRDKGAFERYALLNRILLKIYINPRRINLRNAELRAPKELKEFLKRRERIIIEIDTIRPFVYTIISKKLREDRARFVAQNERLEQQKERVGFAEQNKKAREARAARIVKLRKTIRRTRFKA